MNPKRIFVTTMGILLANSTDNPGPECPDRCRFVMKSGVIIADAWQWLNYCCLVVLDVFLACLFSILFHPTCDDKCVIPSDTSACAKPCHPPVFIRKCMTRKGVFRKGVEELRTGGVFSPHGNPWESHGGRMNISHVQIPTSYHGTYWFTKSHDIRDDIPKVSRTDA